ncbi:hypothetical protein FO519_003655 [Halicephalobus sp. NKZ332]|nr:hypothetical protein FO519_003655 [Halicephalobus sp. NKZ332]
MSAKKKKIVSECPGCGFQILTRDSEKHRNECGRSFSESSIPLIAPKVGFVATTATLVKRDTFLPPDYFEGGTVEVKYFGKSYIFKVPVSVEEKLASLSLEDGSSEHSKVSKISYNPTISIGERSTNKKEISGRVGFEKIGGLSKAKSELITFLIDPIKRNTEACSIVIWGLTGSGKSLLLSALSDILPNSHFVNSSNFSNIQSSVNEDTVLLIDNFEIKSETKNSEGNVDFLCRILDEKKFKAVILSARSIENLDLRLRRRFPVEIELMVPSPDERLEILKLVLENETISEEEIKELARNTHGFTGADLVSLAKLASHLPEAEISNNPSAVKLSGQSSDGNPTIHVDRFTAARRRIRPTGIRQFVLEVPDVKWEDIGGEEELKKEIEQAVIWPFKHPEAFKRLGLDPPSGILLYGPPGCSKTLIARALAAQSKLNFLSVKGPELFSKWVGESERAVRDLFHRARQVAPAVLFFDEIDAVATRRGGDSSSGVSDRVLAQLLTELDGLEKSTGVIVLAATNRPETLDGAILRPGRLDRSLYVPLPDFLTRVSIFELQLKKMTCSSNMDVEKLSKLTEGYSGAEIVALCKNAGFLAMRQDLNSKEIQWNHFQDALKIIVPRTDRKTLSIYENFSKGVQL